MTIFCPNCGEENDVTARFCVSCGADMPRQAMKAKNRAKATRDHDVDVDDVGDDTRTELRLSTTLSAQYRAAFEQATGIQPAEGVNPGVSPSRLSTKKAAARIDAAMLRALSRMPTDERTQVSPTTLGIDAPEALTPAGLRENSLPAPESVEHIPQRAARLSLGFDPDNDIVIPRTNISGHHAVLALQDGTYYLRDLNSTNGTYVNDHRVQCAIVHPGDHINLGSYSFVLDSNLTGRLTKEAADLHATQAMSPVRAPAQMRTVVIGRDSSADIVLDAPQISRQHVRFTETAHGWLVEDLGSANGTFLNERTSQPLSSKVEVGPRDVIYMGSYRFPISRLDDFIDNRGYDSGSMGALAMPADRTTLTIGRGSDNDIVVDATQVSRHHARVVRKDKTFYLEDLGSANGTFLNGERITRAELAPDDTVSFGTYAVRLDLARGAVQKSYRGDILLQAENIRVDVVNNGKPKRLLDGISFTAYPTEFIGIMGPSGAGKTTLLMALIGYIRPTYGRTLINGDDLSTHYDRYRGAIGYVPQEDIIHSELTVYEALYYSAKLRLPPDTSDREIERRIMTVLTDLEIAETRDVLIGSPERKGISGGQRKRVNLAQELLTEPSFLVLDEPTSGLASEDASNVMRLLRKLANQGRTILLTIHQPSLQVYRTLDNVIYLADGEEVYYGPTYPDSILYFHPGVRQGTPAAEEILSDPGSVLRPIVDAKRAGEPMETFAARYRQSQYYQQYVIDRRKNQDVNLTGSSERQRPKFEVHQLVTLCRRYMTIKLKDRQGTSILLIQAPIIAVLINLVFLGLDHGTMNRLEYMPYALFLLVVSAIWFGCSGSAREIVAERAIYQRERMVNLSIPAYVGSKFAILAGISLIQCFALLAITYPVLDIQGNPLYHLATLWLCALAGTGMGLLLSATVRTSGAALALVPLLLIPQVILGGAIMPISQMQDPSWTMTKVMASRWGFEGALQTEHLSDAYELAPEDMPKPLGPGLPAPPPPPNPIDRFFGEEVETWLAVDLGVLGGFTVLMLMGTALVMVRRDKV